MASKTVVRKRQHVTEQRFHALMIAGLARAAVSLGGKGALADRMDLTGAGLAKIFAGGMTNPKRLWDLLEHEPTALDDVAKAYGWKLVDKDSVCDTDDVAVLLARLLLWLESAKHPQSPGGRRIVTSELTPVEAVIRELHGATGAWIDIIDEARAPSGLRRVG